MKKIRGLLILMATLVVAIVLCAGCTDLSGSGLDNGIDFAGHLTLDSYPGF